MYTVTKDKDKKPNKKNLVVTKNNSKDKVSFLTKPRNSSGPI